MSVLTFELPDEVAVQVDVIALYNAGYAGVHQESVRAHIAELAALGVPAPSTTPTLYPIASYLASQSTTIQVQHGRTSGEAEWALIIAGPEERDVLIAAACDHTDRDLEVHGVAWSKNASPNVLSRRAWRLTDICDHLDSIRLRAWVGDNDLIQDAAFSDLLPPAYWLKLLADRGDCRSGVVLVSGTVPMRAGVNPFARRWRVELHNEITGDAIDLCYDVDVLPAPIG